MPQSARRCYAGYGDNTRSTFTDAGRLWRLVGIKMSWGRWFAVFATTSSITACFQTPCPKTGSDTCLPEMDMSGPLGGALQVDNGSTTDLTTRQARACANYLSLGHLPCASVTTFHVDCGSPTRLLTVCCPAETKTTSTVDLPDVSTVLVVPLQPLHKRGCVRCS